MRVLKVGRRRVGEGRGHTHDPGRSGRVEGRGVEGGRFEGDPGGDIPGTSDRVSGLWH